MQHKKEKENAVRTSRVMLHSLSCLQSELSGLNQIMLIHWGKLQHQIRLKQMDSVCQSEGPGPGRRASAAVCVSVWP